MPPNASVLILQRQAATPRTAYVRDTLINELGRIGISVISERNDATAVLALDVSGDALLGSQSFELAWSTPIDKEELYDPHFTWHGQAVASLLDIDSSDVATPQGNIRGGDEAGLLYGALEFVERCRVGNRLPIRPFTVVRRPKMPFRSACLLLIRGSTYNVPISRAEFPWFYDRVWWNRYLDFLAAQGFTAVTLWNMHPFPFFCMIPNHPEVKEIPPDQLDENRAILRWLCGEFAKRNLEIIWHFYNVYVSPSFMKHHGLPALHKFRDDQVVLVENYMRECVSAFVNEFPAVGLMACVGEGVPGGVAEAFAGKVLIDAINRTGRHPPFILRQWSVVTVENVRRHVLGKYDNLYVMIKHAAEHVAGAVPDSRVQQWLSLGVPVLVNMHMLSEVDPWHWAPPAFIRECCLNYQAMGVKGVHLYSRWPWRVPVTACTGVEGNEFEHNWIYHEAWGRYLFDPIRDHDEEDRHWVRRITRTGALPATARAIADYLDLSGRCLPRLQQHLWIHYDNHSVLSAGFTLGQMLLARSMHGRKTVRTDRLEDLLPLRLQAHGAAVSAQDYTFADACAKSRLEIQRALACLAGAEAEDPASSLLKRFKVEGLAISKVIDFLDRKAEALCRLQEYLRTQALSHLEEAERKLSESLVAYREVAKIGDELFEVISDVPPVYPFLRALPNPYHWREIRPLFEEELVNLRNMMRIERSSEEWNLLWQSGDPRVRPGAALAAKIVKEGGIWLTGAPDFLPWPWRFERLKRMEIMPSASFVFDEYNGNLMAYPRDVRAWIERGGRLSFYSFHGYPWSESQFLAAVVGSEKLETRSVEIGGPKLIGIKDSANTWSWMGGRNGYGVAGILALGQGTIRYSANPGKDD